MVFLRRGYVPHNIPVERSVVFRRFGRPWTIPAWQVSCVEEWRDDDDGRTVVMVFPMAKPGVEVEDTFDDIDRAFTELKVSHD